MWAPAAFRVAALCATVTTVAAKVELPMWFGDGMVFQVNSEYGARSFLNGKASPGEKVMVTFNGGANFPGVADENGDWEVQFNGGGVRCGTENCGNVTVTGESDGDVHFAKNVVAGDVIFCSGQVKSGALCRASECWLRSNAAVCLCDHLLPAARCPLPAARRRCCCCCCSRTWCSRRSSPTTRRRRWRRCSRTRTCASSRPRATTARCHYGTSASRAARARAAPWRATPSRATSG
jgi:hypothetical protein